MERQAGPDREATDLGYSVGIGYQARSEVVALADFHNDMNRIAGQRFRAMLWLTIALVDDGVGR